jgi:hypothetical protein
MIFVATVPTLCNENIIGSKNVSIIFVFSNQRI